VGAVASGSVDILVLSEPGIEPYFSIPLPDPPIEGGEHLLVAVLTPMPTWSIVLHGPTSTGCYPCWRLTGEEILWTFFSRRVQSLHEWEAVMRVSLGPSYLIYPSLMKLGGTKVNTRV
jgi:hypothetical protein